MFLIPADHDKYIDLNIQLYVHGKLTKADGTDLDDKDNTCVVNNLLHSQFNEWNISLNGVTITRAAELYHYRHILRRYLPTVAIQPLHFSETRSGIVIQMIWALARINRLKHPVETRGAARNATE